MNKKQKQFNIRLRYVFAGVMLVGFVLIANLFHIQIRIGERLRAQADGQYVVSTFNAFERGNIYFKDKNGDKVLAAGQKKGYKISVNPSKIKESDKDFIFETINEFSPLDKNLFTKRISQNKRTYIEIVNHLSKEDGEAIKKTLGRKIGLHSEKWRTYPLKSTASHVLGFLGYDKDDNFGGRYGLENFYEGNLKRENSDLYTNFFARTLHGVQDIIGPETEIEGDIIGTIDPQLQIFLEKNLESIQEKWNSQVTGGIIMHAKTGEIHAMTSLPNYDNNNFKKESLAVFKNPLVSNVYEFGSVIKPLVVAMGINDGVINAKTEYYDKGSVKIGKYTISNFDKRGRGLVNMQDVLNQSLNTGMVFISKKISKKSFRDYFEKYGFKEKSGIDLPNDVTGLTSNLKSNRDIEFANISFGQGIATSPMSFIKAVSALTNDGKTLVPHLIKEIEYTNGFSKKIDYSDKGEQVISPETAGEISRMLVNVFDNYRNGDVKLPHHSVAAKTGTAQIAHPEGGYYKDRNLHSFFGYFPAYKPEFIVFLYTVDPKKVKYSSQTLLDPFRTTAKYMINYYNIPPDR
ncbi:MAG: penicillin-binding protein 2 [Candidatus Pacebacteria bacterium]|nr:penicillin-binding protein 2 [Candidatus Paceibacterota bacterium]